LTRPQRRRIGYGPFVGIVSLAARNAPDDVSPTTWDRIAEAASRVGLAAGRLSTRQSEP